MIILILYGHIFNGKLSTDSLGEPEFTLFKKSLADYLVNIPPFTLKTWQFLYLLESSLLTLK